MSGAFESYKQLGPLSLGIFWISIGLLVWRLKLGKSTSISGHLAANKKITVIFGIIGTLITPMVFLFFFKWFSPHFHFSWIFNMLIIVIWALYFASIIVPDTKGLAHRIHARTATTASFLLVPTTILMIANPHIGVLARIFMIAALIAMLICGRALSKSQYSAEKFLIYQAFYFLSFDLSVIIATYVR